MVGVRFQPEDIAEIAAWAAAEGVTRSEAVRHAVAAVIKLGGLKRAKKPLIQRLEVQPPAQSREVFPAPKAAQAVVVAPAPGSLRATLDAVQLGPAPYVPRPKKGR
jgi:hypothetical protein